MNNILFRADSSSTIGLGHIMRDLVLAEQFRGNKVIFACQNLEGNIINKIPYQVEILKSNSIDELGSLIKSLDIDMIVIDHYDIDYNFEKQLKTQNSKLKILSFDDTYEKHYCDILLNHNISADEKRYKDLVPKHCELRCGSRYTLIRDEFKKEKVIRYRKDKKTIFIAMGGSDHSNILLKILKSIPDLYKVNVVTTSSNNNLRQLKRFIFLNKMIKLHIDSKNIAKLMNMSDIAIISPSVISHEVLYMQLPFITILTGNDQKEVYKYLKRKRIMTMQQFSSKQLYKNIQYLDNNLKQYKRKLKRIVKNAKF